MLKQRAFRGAPSPDVVTSPLICTEPSRSAIRRFTALRYHLHFEDRKLKQLHRGQTARGRAGTHANALIPSSSSIKRPRKTSLQLQNRSNPTAYQEHHHGLCSCAANCTEPTRVQCLLQLHSSIAVLPESHPTRRAAQLQHCRPCLPLGPCNDEESNGAQSRAVPGPMEPRHCPEGIWHRTSHHLVL